MFLRGQASDTVGWQVYDVKKDSANRGDNFDKNNEEKSIHVLPSSRMKGISRPAETKFLENITIAQLPFKGKMCSKYNIPESKTRLKVNRKIQKSTKIVRQINQ